MDSCATATTNSYFFFVWLKSSVLAFSVHLLATHVNILPLPPAHRTCFWPTLLHQARHGLRLRSKSSALNQEGVCSRWQFETPLSRRRISPCQPRLPVTTEPTLMKDASLHDAPCPVMQVQAMQTFWAFRLLEEDIGIASREKHADCICDAVAQVHSCAGLEHNVLGRGFDPEGLVPPILQTATKGSENLHTRLCFHATFGSSCVFTLSLPHEPPPAPLNLIADARLSKEPSILGWTGTKATQTPQFFCRQHRDARNGDFSGSPSEGLEVGVEQSLADCFPQCEGLRVSMREYNSPNCDYCYSCYSCCYVVIINRRTSNQHTIEPSVAHARLQLSRVGDCGSKIVLCNSWRRLMRSCVLVKTSVFTVDGGENIEPEPKEQFSL